MIHKGLNAIHLLIGVDFGFIISVLKSLENWIKLVLAGFNFLIAHVADVRHRLTKRLFGSFSFLIVPHLTFPCVELFVSLLKDHYRFVCSV